MFSLVINAVRTAQTNVFSEYASVDECEANHGSRSQSYGRHVDDGELHRRGILVPRFFGRDVVAVVVGEDVLRVVGILFLLAVNLWDRADRVTGDDHDVDFVAIRGN